MVSYTIFYCKYQSQSQDLYFNFNSQLMAFVVTFVFISGIIGLIWAMYNYKKLGEINIRTSEKSEHEEQRLLDSFDPVKIGEIIQEGASEFIVSEYKILFIFIIIMGTIIYVCVDNMEHYYSTLSFFIGALTSMFCGAFGMKVATYSNYRTTLEAKHSLGRAFKTAFRAGCVMGFTLVAVSMMVLMIIILIYQQEFGLTDTSDKESYFEKMFEAIAGFGLGGSTVALFARVGGGIYTKAADVGSDLVGKVESNLPEDSPKNPATIADNVGDNVGDVAGMSADLFGSFAEATCAALVIGSNSLETLTGYIHIDQLTFVLGIPAVGILACVVITYLITEGQEIEQAVQVQGELKKQLIYSTLLLLPCLYILSKSAFPETFKFVDNNRVAHQKVYNDIFGCLAFGLVAGLIIGYVTEVMTSYSYVYVQELAKSCKTGAATNIIYGLALGYLSTIIPTVVLSFVVYYSHSTLGYYGVALAALGMLSNLPICLAIDGYGPISDNAGGIAEMSELDQEVRERTDVLDSAGNTTAAIGKGFAIGSATLVGFALYGAFMHTCYVIGSLKQGEMSFDDPMIFTSLLFGAMIPYAFSAMTMKSVGLAALGMVAEVRRQIKEHPGILDGTERPNYKSCIKISTQSSLKEMIMPGLLVTVTPFALGFIFGPKALLGFLPGAIVSGVQMAISASNTGGAWDNAKKYIEAGLMKDGDVVVKKGSDIHKAAVIGDTVGDPLKDTSGPSLNILIKLMAILSLVFCKYFSKQPTVNS